MISLKQISYGGWPNCYQLSNGSVDLILTTDIGPRIMRFGFVGEENEFAKLPETVEPGSDGWISYGGHRLWHAPEHMPRSYSPDNTPIKLEEHHKFVRLVQPVEPTTGIQKEIDIYLDDEAAKVTVVHRLTNQNMWTIELAPWALSVMTTGGVGIVPLPPRGPHHLNILPANSMALWAYTNMADPRWVWGHEFIMLNQDTSLPEPQKIGFWVPDGWAAYARNGHLFVKMIEANQDQVHPDLNSNVELFTNDAILEVETLGPLVKLAPETAVTHTEIWHLFRNIPQPTNEADIINHIMPVVKTILP